MKRILCFILSFALCLGLCPVGVWAEEDEAEPNPGDGGFITEADETEPNPGDGGFIAEADETQPDPDDGGFIAEADETEPDPGDGESDLSTNPGTVNGDFVMHKDGTYEETHPADNEYKFDTRGYTYTFTGTNSPAILVTGEGRLTLMGAGTVTATGDGSSVIEVQSGGSLTVTDATAVTATGVGSSGIEVQSGGSLTITDAEAYVEGKKYALNIASGAVVRLSGGKYKGPGGAIVFNSENDTAADYAKILEVGYAFFDKYGNLLSPADVANAESKYTILTVGACSGHSEHGWTHTPGSTTHTWTCPYCGGAETEKCTFTFDGNGNGSCVCGNGISVAVDEKDLTGLVYDGKVKPEDVSITVTLTDGSGKELVKGTDYTVDYTPQKDAGEVTVKVIGVTFNGTFIKTFNVEPDQPGIEWDSPTCAVDYTGSPVDSTKLPNITITIKASEDLHPYLQYFYRKTGETEFTAGLPTNAGEYEVKAYLPESQNYKEAETGLLTLTIRKIPAVATAPAAKTLNYNREAQELVTAGALAPGAAAEGAKIEFALAQAGPYSTDIPTGTTVQNYGVWYRVTDTENYSGQSGQLSAQINYRKITPTVELEYYTTVYTGGDKEPKVTVKDGEYVIPNSEYAVNYANNRNVGTATVTVSNASNGNYELTTATAAFKITNQPQAALSITKQPDTVTYGDKFILGTSGGSGSGDVTWEITEGKDSVAKVGEKSGQVTIVGDGSFTVQATKSGTYNGVTNYDNATASWTMTAEKKPVTAIVTAEDKFYGETYGGGDLKAARIHAVVEEGVLPGDEITITGLTGEFEDENAGENKKVTVNTDNAKIEGHNSEHYAVTYSSLSVKATINKAVVHITTAPGAANLVYSGEAQELIGTGAVMDTSGVSVEYAMSKDGTYSTDIPKGTNAGAYTVWYRVKETDNYTGLAPASVDVTINKKPVAPAVTLSGDGLTHEDGKYFYIYDGNAKEPVVTLTETEGTIPAGEYTVSYTNNVNVGADATVTVTAKDDGNYTFTNAPVTATFEIKKELARVITKPEAAGDPLTFNTSDQKLVTAGTASGGTMVYSLTKDDADSYSADIPARTNAADYTVYYKVRGDGNHSDSEVGEVTVTIAPKTVNNPTIELLDGDGNALVSYTYDGSAKKPTVVVKDGSTVIAEGEYNLIFRNNTDAGDATVSITDKTGGNYTVTGSTTFVIQKANITFTTDPTNAGVSYNGTPQELLKEGTFDGGTVQYALGSKTSSYSDAIPTATNAGTYKVYYRVIGDKNHNDYPSTEIEATIQRKPLTEITIELSPRGFEYDGTPKMPAVTVRDGNTVLPEEEYEWTCDVDDPTNVGTYTITVIDKAGGNYDLTEVVENNTNTATFTIGQITQDALVIEGKPAAANYGDSFQLTVSGGSGDGAVSWEATGAASVDTIDGNVTITISDVGEATVTVKKAADTNYRAAQAEWTFTAAPMPIEAAVVAANKVFDGTKDATVSSVGINTKNNDEVTIDPASITADFDTPSVGAGKTVTLDTSKVKVDGADAGKYAISYPATVTADITQATTTISPAPAKIDGLIYNSQPQALVTAGVSNVGFIVYSLDGNSFSPEIPTGTDAGTYKVYYRVDATADYTDVAANTTPITVTIAPKAITPVIEVKESSYLYDGTKKAPEVTVRDGKTVIDAEQYTVEWENADGVTFTDILTAAGSYTATITSVTNGNYTFSETATVKIVAGTQGAVKITGKPEHVYYGDTITTLDTTGGIGNGTIKWTLSDGTKSAINKNTGVLEVKDTGTFTVTAERTVPNYAPVSDTWTFTVEPKPVTAEVTVADKVYDGDNTATVTSVVVNNLVDPDNDTITIAGLKGTFADVNVGSGKTVRLDRSDPGFSIGGDTDKYTVTIPATATANITPRPVTVSVTLSDHDLKTDASGYFYTYDGNEKTPAVAVTGSDDGGYSAALVSSDYVVSYANNKNASTETVTATATVKSAEGGNYTFDTETVHFEIRNGAAVLTASPQAKDLTFDGTLQDLVTVGTATGGKVVYALDEDGFNKDDANSYSEKIPQGTNARTYTVYYMVKGDANHDDTAPGQVSVTIKPREITAKITLSPASYVYDGNECKPAVTVEDGATEVDDGEYTVTYRDNTNAGTATVIVSDNNGGNYIVNGSATFEITKKAPVFTAPEAKTGLKYNGAVQELVKAGVSHDGTVVYSVNGGNYSAAVPSASAVDDYTITYKVVGDANHSDTEPVTLDMVTIAKNTVNNPAISLSSTRFQYNNGEQKPTVTVCDDNGLLIPENEYSATITPTTGGSASIVDVGTYTVTITTPESSNYVITANNTRTFEIVPANQETISITGTKAQVRYGDVIQLGTTGGVGGSTVTWTVTGSSTVSSTGLLTVKDVGGPITVTATRSAGGNYNDVSAAWEFSAAKKQVTAVVTADDRPYAANDTSATVHVSVPDSELVSGDSIKIENVTGSFADPNIGTDKKVTVDSGDASVTGTNSGNYEISYPATTTASITAVAATVDADPTPNDLTYDASQAQELVTAGEATGGIMVYSLDGTNFTASIPKAKDAGTYTVYFKAQGDGNHTDSGVGTKDVTIDKQSVTPQIKLTPSTAKYDGKEHKPNVTLWDGANNEIPTSEYIVTYVTTGGANWTDQGTYTVKIENNDKNNNGNYVVNTVTETFTISTTAQNPLTITNKPGLVYYGDTFTLSAVGGSGNAAVEWSVTEGAGVVEIDANGFVTVKGTGPATITATKPGGANYETATATYPLNALKKSITAVVTADDKVYDESDSATIHVTWKDGDLVGDDTINTDALEGTFDNPNVGQNKAVTITGGPIDDSRYEITIPGSTTASILKADAKVPDVTANDRDYNGTAKPLVNGGNDKTTVYSTSRDGVYSANVPTATNAGTYTVWYKNEGDDNHNDSAPKSVTVTISRKKLIAENMTITLSGNDLKVDGGKYSYVYDGTDKKPTVTIKDGEKTLPASEYTVEYSNNKNVSTDAAKGTVTVTCNEGGNYAFDKQPVTFEITSAAARLTKSPEAKNLTYIGPDQEQELVTVGTAVGGHIEYSLDGGTTYSESIPKGETAGTYTVTYKVVGDGNYASSGEIWTVSVTIRPKEIVSPKVTVSGEPYTYDGNAKEPVAADIKVEDGGTEIPASEYTVSFRDNVEAGKATVIITNANGGNYIVNGTGSFTIGKAASSVEEDPKGKTDLPYNGAAQELVTAGSASGGTMVYSVNDGEYSPVMPTATVVGEYTIKYKVLGDGNHNDTDPVPVAASIIVNAVTDPTVQVTPEAVTFNGKKQEPTVKITDKNGFVIDGSEYTVTYANSEGKAVTDPTSVGKYTLTITGKENGNYTFTFSEDKKPTFEILPADQTPLTITGTRERVCYGDMFQLGTSGGSGTIAWAVCDGAPASIENGLLTITGVGSVTVTATSTATGHNDQTASWSFFAEKKPVTAVVTAASKTYNGEKDADVTATLQSSDLVSGDTVKITLPGSSFDDPNAGANKTVRVDSTDPKFDGSTGNYANYSISYPATAAASIFKADIKAEDVNAPTAADNLTYTGLALVLVKPGSCPDGTLEYSTDNISYSSALPTGANADSYEVWYRVKGDGNHNDTAGTKLESGVTIARQDVTDPKIELKPIGASYDGAVHTPDVEVKDNNGRTIPTGEYTVTYGDGDWKTVGTYEVTITDAKEDGGNYDITGAKAEFKIHMMGQNPLTITNQPSRTIYYGDAFTLSTTGGSGTGTVDWNISGPAGIDQNGNVKITGSGPVTVFAAKQADGNYAATTATWSFSAEKKPVKAIVTADDKVYDGVSPAAATIHVTWKDGDLVGTDTIDTDALRGTFDNPNVGQNKTVTITGGPIISDKYEISWNTTTTASITAGAATVSAPTVQENLTYTGQAQPLVNAGSATNGTILYSLDGIIYGPNVPKGTNADSYTVWYKVEGSDNYSDVAPDVLPVTIEPKTVNNPTIELSPESFDYDGSAKVPSVTVRDGSTVIPIGEYTVSYSNNVQAGENTAKVTISDAPGGNYVVSGTKNFTIKAGAATLTLAPQERELTYNGKAQALVTPGTAVNGHLEYSTDGASYSMTIPKGTDVDEYFVFYKVVGDNGYSDTAPQVLTVTIEPKSVTPTIKVGGVSSYSTPYTGSAVTPSVTVIVEGKALTEDTDYYIVGYSDNTTPGTATVTVASMSGGNYQFYADATFVITKGKAVFSADPIPKTGLVYIGDAQALMTFAGYTQDGTVVCSLNGGAFYPFIPKGTDIGDYVVMVKVQGDETHADSDIKTYQVTIAKNVLTEAQLGVTLSDSSLKYTGGELKPTVTVRDGEGNIIAASEYSVSYKNNINVGTADVTVTSSTKNYSFSKTVHFTITDADAPTLKITGQPDTVCYGDTLKLGTTGGSGTVAWSVESGSESAESLGGGRFKIKGSGSITVKASAGDISDTWTFYADPKPVRAIVTAADKVYDSSKTAKLTVIVNSGLASGDTAITTVTAEGQFVDANVGANKTVIITKLTVPEEIGRKYDISCDSTITASITPAAAAVKTAPDKNQNLTSYTGQPQPLVTPGVAENGNMAYSLDGINYNSFTVPTGTDAGSYTVWYKAVATDENHKDSAPDKVTGVTIAPNTDNPTVTCVPNTFQFDGTPKTPTVVVQDSAQRIIPDSEYNVVIPTATTVDTYTVTVKDKSGTGNYEFTGDVTGTFKIEESSQAPLSVDTDKFIVYYGDIFRLNAAGGSGNGAIKWSIATGAGSIAEISSSGVVTVKGTGGFTVEAYREAAGGYGQSNTVSVPFEARPKPVTPIVTADDKPYDRTTAATLHAAWTSGDLVGDDAVTLSVGGEFASADVGTGKQVKVTSHTAQGTGVEKYDIRWPAATTASVYKVNAVIDGENAPKPNDLTYAAEADGSPKAQALVTGGSTVGGIGTIVYSTSEKGVYSTDIPTGTNAGSYSVWYKVADSVNYTGIPAAEVEVEIKKADPGVSSNPTASGSVGQTLRDIPLSGGSFGVSSGKFAWEDDSQTVEAGKFYNVIFTPGDMLNYKTITVQIQVTGAAQASLNGGGSTPAQAQAQTQTTIRDGAASTVLSASDGNKLVQEAAASQSRNVVIKPEISGNVTKSEVSIPSATVNQLGSGTDASLTVASPVGDVTIPNRALDTLGKAGGSVSVVTEQVGQGVALTLSSGSETVTQIPGGVTLSVPVEDASPGTVAVVVHEDGTRETVKNSVVNGDVMNIPLSGSATVEIVDNSKDFDDVPADSWASDAVAFASSHELFNGTSETTFSPDTAMSRGMLATVLYRLEGDPDMELTDAFSDVADSAWYADGVAWAASNGIADGYGDNQFGPNDAITREQFVVMLWRYAGMPGASGQELDFTDADEASGFAREALCWAVENGIINGVGGGALNPKGTATRAQAAQLLKNYMERA